MLPLYGSGAVSVLIITLPVRDNLPLVFIMGMIGATLLEFFTGTAVPGALLGLQPSEIQCKGIYLSGCFSVLGRFLYYDGESCAYSD